MGERMNLKLRKRRGEWILVSGIIMILLMTLATQALSQVLVTKAESPEQTVYGNVKTESQYVVNVIVAEDATSFNIENRLMQWAAFLKNYTVARATNFKGYFIVGLPTENGLNVTISNFYGEQINSTNLSAGASTINIPSIADNTATTVNIPTLPDYFQFDYNLTLGDENLVENGGLNVLRRVFSIVRIRVSSGQQVWQTLQIN